MTILEDLYYGNITPIERGFKRGESIQLQRTLKAEDEFKATLTAEQKEKWDDIQNQNAKLNTEFEAEAFVTGFKLSTKIMIEAIPSKE